MTAGGGWCNGEEEGGHVGKEKCLQLSNRATYVLGARHTGTKWMNRSGLRTAHKTFRIQVVQD